MLVGERPPIFFHARMHRRICTMDMGCVLNDKKGMMRNKRHGTRPVVLHAIAPAFSAAHLRKYAERHGTLFRTCANIPRGYSYDGRGRREKLECTHVRRSHSPLPAQRLCMDQIKRAGRHGNWEEVRRLFADFQSRVDAQFFLDLNMYNAVIDAAARCGKTAIAMGLLVTINKRGMTPNAVTYNSAIKACGNGRQWEKAVSLLDEMRNAGVIPDVVSYNSAITACGSGGQWEKAVSLLEEMRNAGVSPNGVSYTAAITTCGNGGQWEKAVSLFDEMRNSDVVRLVPGDTE